MARREGTSRGDAGNAKARLVLVEGHVMVRQGLAHLLNLEPDLSVCGQYSDSHAAVSAVRHQLPDLVLADITLRSGNGLEMIKVISTEFPALPVLVVTMHDEALYAEMALRSGAMGYIMKSEPLERLLAAVRCVLGGKIYVSEAITLQMVRQQVRGAAGQARVAPEELLSDRELQVFQLIGQWRGTRQIAEELHLSVKTVEYYRGKIKEKLRLESGSSLTRFATECANSAPPAPEARLSA